MKAKRIFTPLIIALVAMTSCTTDDNEVIPASQEQLEAVTGHWYAELAISGETANWRTEEEDDMTSYDHIGAMIYLNGHVTDASYWGYIYIKDHELVNFDGIFMRDEEANFDFSMDSDGNITPTSYLPDAPEVSNMRYADGIITADVSYKGHSMTITFTRPTEEQEPMLKEYWELLAEAGIVGGFADDGDSLDTEVTDENATEPSRVRHHKE